MAKFHIGRKGKAAICSAKAGNCPFGGDDNHYSSREAANKAAEDKLAKQNAENVFQGVSKKNDEKDVKKEKKNVEKPNDIEEPKNMIGVGSKRYWSKDEEEMKKLSQELGQDIVNNIKFASNFVSDNSSSENPLLSKDYSDTIKYLKSALGGGSEFYQKQGEIMSSAMSKAGFSGVWNQDEVRSFYRYESTIGQEKPTPHTIFYKGDMPGMPYKLTEDSMSFKDRKDGLEKIEIFGGKIRSRTYRDGDTMRKENYTRDGETLIENSVEQDGKIVKKESYTIDKDGNQRGYISHTSTNGENFTLEKANVDEGKIKISDDYSQADLVFYKDSTFSQGFYDNPQRSIQRIGNNTYEVTYTDKEGNSIKETYEAEEYNVKGMYTGHFIRQRTINGEPDNALLEKVEKRKEENNQRYNDVKEMYDNGIDSQILRYKGRYIRGEFKYITNDYGKRQRVLEASGRTYYLSTAKNPKTAEANNAKKGIELIDVPNVKPIIYEETNHQGDSLGVKREYSYFCSSESVQESALKNGLITEEENNSAKRVSYKEKSFIESQNFKDITSQFRDKQ